MATALSTTAAFEWVQRCGCTPCYSHWGASQVGLSPRGKTTPRSWPNSTKAKLEGRPKSYVGLEVGQSPYPSRAALLCKPAYGRDRAVHASSPRPSSHLECNYHRVMHSNGRLQLPDSLRAAPLVSTAVLSPHFLSIDYEHLELDSKRSPRPPCPRLRDPWAVIHPPSQAAQRVSPAGRVHRHHGPSATKDIAGGRSSTAARADSVDASSPSEDGAVSPTVSSGKSVPLVAPNEPFTHEKGQRPERSGSPQRTDERTGRPEDDLELHEVETVADKLAGRSRSSVLDASRTPRPPRRPSALTAASPELVRLAQSPPSISTRLEALASPRAPFTPKPPPPISPGRMRFSTLKGTYEIEISDGRIFDERHLERCTDPRFLRS